MPRKPASRKEVETLTHGEAKRKNIPPVEYQPIVDADDERSPVRAAYARRNRDLDPQLVWRGKDEQDRAALDVPAPPLYIQEKVHPKALIDDLMRSFGKGAAPAEQLDLFADFNGLPEDAERTEFYRHEANWSNRMILGDSLRVMASLAEREGLRGKVQCIYLDPPYGIRFNSNFQWSTTSRDVKDGKLEHITREPEQVKAFRDTWRDGIHSYLAYLRDRLTAARDLLAESGSIFVQIGDENVHRVRALMDEVFGNENFISTLPFRTHSALGVKFISSPFDYILWFAKDISSIKYRDLYIDKEKNLGTQYRYVEEFGGLRRSMSDLERSGVKSVASNSRIFRLINLPSSGYTASCTFDFDFQGKVYPPSNGRSWKTTLEGMNRCVKANRVHSSGTYLNFVLYYDDFAAMRLTGSWNDTFAELSRNYIVQTGVLPIQRCILMTTDPGDLVLDPTCGSGTTAYVAEQWGRRWITIDTSRVALALARARIMGARYSYYLLADSPEGQRKEAEIAGAAPPEAPTSGDIRQGFVYERVPHITLKSIANNTEIDVIWERWQKKLEPLREKLNETLRENWQEWEVPREAGDGWPDEAKQLHSRWRQARIARQQEIDASIAAKADYEYLYDKPHEDKRKTRVAGPFTVESLSPHRMPAVGADDELIDRAAGAEGPGFVETILEQLKVSGVQQAHKEDKIEFSALTPRPGRFVCAEGRYEAAGKSQRLKERRAGIFIGPEFGTVPRSDLVLAAQEAADAGFDALIACAFNYEAPAAEFDKLGPVPVLKARMNADLHMAGDLKNTGRGNLFVVFGEPDIEIREAEGGRIEVEIRGVDVFHPNSGEVRSDGPEGIACWFIDTDYNEESFFVRQAYFLGANDPYKALKTTLKAEVDREAWETLRSAVSRPFAKPQSGRIAVKVINHLGDEVMKVFRV